MKITSITKNPLSLVLQARTLTCLALAALLTPTGQAQTVGTWNVNSGGYWSPSGNWTGGVPGSAGDTANLTYPITAARTVTNDVARTIGSLFLGNSGFSWTLAATNASTALTLNNNGAGASITLSNATATETITSPLILADNLTVSNGVSLYLNGVVSGASTNSFTKNGAGTLIFGGGNINTYSGVTTINAGTVQLGQSGQYGNLGSGSTSVVVNAGATLSFYQGETISQIISGAGNVTTLSSVSGTETMAATNTYTGSTTVNGVGMNVPYVTLSGMPSSIGASGPGATNLVISGGGTLAYTGTTPATTDRLLQIGTATATSTSGILANNATAAANFLAFTNTGSVAYGSNNQARTFTLAGSNTGTNVFAPVLGNNGTGVISFTKSGAGSWTLTSPETYTGATTISAGNLYLSGSASLANTPAITTASGTLFDVSGLSSTFSLGSAQTLTAGSPLTVAAITNINGSVISVGTNNIAGSGTPGTLTVNGNLTLNGGTLVYDLPAAGINDTIALAGTTRNLNLSGTVLVQATGGVGSGTLVLITNAASISGTAANLAFAGTVPRSATATFNVAAPVVSLTVSGATANSLLWQGTNGPSWDLATTTNWLDWTTSAADRFYPLDNVVFDDTGISPVILSGQLNPGTITFSNNAVNYALGGSGGLAGVGSLAMAGTGFVIISNNNSYTGGTTIPSGTIRIGNVNALGSGPLTFSGGAIDLYSNSLTVGNFSGFGSLITDSNYVTTGTGNFSHTDTLTVYETGSNSYTGLINNGGAIVGTATNTSIIAFTKNGPGYLLITNGASTFNGPITNNAGTLDIESIASGAYHNFTLASGAQLFIGYGTADSFGYHDGVVLNGSGVTSTNTLYLRGGKSYQFSANSAAGLYLTAASSTVQAFGTGNATLTGGDVNYIMLNVQAAASGAVLANNINISGSSYGFRSSVTAGANNATGDLLIGGVITGGPGSAYAQNGQSVHFDKEGTGSLLVTNASTGLDGLWLKNGAVILSGGNNRLSAAPGLVLGDGSSNSGRLLLNGVGQSFTNVVTYGTGVSNSIVGYSATTSTLTINNAAADTNSAAIGGPGTYNNNLALVKSGIGALTLFGPLLYTNNTTITAGTLTVGSLTNWDGATLSVVDTAGTLNATNLQLGTAAGSTLAITSFASATTAPIASTNLVIKGTTTVTLSGAFSTGQYPLIKFLSGSFSGGGSFTVQQAGLPPGVSATIVTNVANNSFDLVLATTPLIWVGATNGIATTTWDNGITTNWTLAGQPDYFTNNDIVLINDSAVSTTLNLVSNVAPYSVQITNGANNFTLTAAGGSLTGTMGLLKQGTGVLAITESNSFTGGTIISGGVINLQNSYGLNGTAVSVASGTELQLQGGLATPTNTTFSLAGTGTNVTGALRSLNGTNLVAGNITFTAPSRINADSGLLTLTNGITAGTNRVFLGGAGNVTISTVSVSSSGGVIWDGTGTNAWNVNPSISAGGFTISNGVANLNVNNFGGTFTPLITIAPNGTLIGTVVHATGGGASLVINKGTWLQDAEDYKQSLTMVDGYVGPGPNLTGGGADLRVGYAGGAGTYNWYVTNSVVGSVINSKLDTVTVSNNLDLFVSRGLAASDLTLNGAIISTGNINFNGTGITTITATNSSNTGNLTVSNGTVRVTGVLGTANITVAGGVLGGNGTLGGPATVLAGGTLQPGLGGTNTTSLTTSVLTLGGTTVFNLNRTAPTNCSSITSTSLINLGGTLTVTNVGSALQGGDTFTLFNGGALTGNFTTTNLPALTGSLTWDWNPSSGILSVVSAVNTSPTNIVYSLSGNSLTLSWPADYIGWRLIEQVSNLTNGVSANPADWSTVSGSATTNSITITVDPTVPGEYYQLVYP